MKINEVLTEGPLDYLKGAYQGAKTGGFRGILPGAAAAQQQATGQKEVRDFAKGVVDKWFKYYGQTQDSNIQNWANTYFRNKVDLSTIPAPDPKNAQEVSKYFQTLWQQYLANTNTTASSNIPAAPNAPPPAPPQSTGRTQGTVTKLNQVIKSLNKRDLARVKQAVDSALAARQTAPAAATPATPE